MGGCMVLTGRAKDTIVLASGENIEPQPIEVNGVYHWSCVSVADPQAC